MSKTNETIVSAVKGFDKDLRCRGYQFAVGETYEHAGAVVRCGEGGFHSVEGNPLDAFTYYGPADGSRYAVVQASGAISRGGAGDDSKIASGRLYVEAEIRLPDIVKRAVSWVLANAKGNIAQGWRGHAAAQGWRGHAAAQGTRGHAAAQGDSGHAAAQGDSGHAAAQGDSGHAAAQGDSGHAAAQGWRGHAAAQGWRGHAAAQGTRGHAAAQGDSGHAAAQGDSGHAAAQGDSGHAAAQGWRGHAAAQGWRGFAEVRGENSIAAAFGAEGTAMAEKPGSWIVLAYYKPDGAIAHVGAFKVGRDVKPGKRYRLNSRGKPVLAR